MKLIITASLLITLFTTADQHSFPESWEQQTFPQEWVKLYRDKQGYMVYDACEGVTPSIVLNKDTLHMYWQLESQTHLIRKFEKLDKDHYIVYCYGVVTNEGDVIYGVSARHYEVSIIDRNRKLVQWKAIAPDAGDTVQWMMTPGYCQKDFRIVKQKCDPHQKTKSDPEIYDF